MSSRSPYHSEVSHDPLFLFLGALVRAARAVFWSFWWPLIIEFCEICCCWRLCFVVFVGFSQLQDSSFDGRSSIHAPLFTWITTPDINSCTHFTSLVWLIFSSNSPQLQLLHSPNRQNAGQGWELHFRRFSFTMGFLVWAHFFGENARIGSPRTQRIIGCWVPPPHDLLHGVNPINFHVYFRFLRLPFDVVWLLFWEFAAFSL